MSLFDLVLSVLGAGLLVLCGLVGVMNWYLAQPITLFRYGYKGLKQRASPAVLVGDVFFFLGSVCLFAAQPTQSGRDVVLLTVLPVWLMNPLAIPWLLVRGWIAVIYNLIRRPPDGALTGQSLGDWIALFTLLVSLTGILVWTAFLFYRGLSARGFL